LANQPGSLGQTLLEIDEAGPFFIGGAGEHLERSPGQDEPTSSADVFAQAFDSASPVGLPPEELPAQPHYPHVEERTKERERRQGNRHGRLEHLCLLESVAVFTNSREVLLTFFSYRDVKLVQSAGQVVRLVGRRVAVNLLRPVDGLQQEHRLPQTACARLQQCPDGTVTQQQINRMLGNMVPCLDDALPRVQQAIQTGVDPGEQPAPPATPPTKPQGAVETL
jgi:hypothetical protein